MARLPKKAQQNEVVDRVIPIPGWAYNFMIDMAQRERRDVKAQISLILEKAIREEQAQYAKQ